MRLGKHRYYSGVLDIPEGKSGDFSITHTVHPAGTVLDTCNARTRLFGQAGEKVRFPDETRWHSLLEDGGVWMTDLPIEQRQMDDLIRHATGKVLIGGLGLGYAVVAAARKSRVREIVVVEQSADVINLVWQATKRRAEAMMDHPVKLTCVQADLFTFLKDRQDALNGGSKPEFTFALFDIWQADGETCFHTVVVPLRKLAHGVVRKVTCWNEDIMRGQMYQGLATRRLFVDNQHPEMAEMMPTLDKLCEGGHGIYNEWAVPFWRWYREHRHTVDVRTRDWMMDRYVDFYGRPEVNNGLSLLESYPVRKQPTDGETVTV